ncbi:MAG: DUF1841 family protein [Gammaproteobacteria bacterium]
MFYPDDRNALRQMYLEAWRRSRAGLPMEPVQTSIAMVVAEHPEYHELLESEHSMDRDWTPDDGVANPFLHMGMHLAIREQVGTNRPPGIATIHNTLSNKLGSHHEAEHLMMESLGEVLWRAQRDGVLPDDAVYLENLKRL